VTNSNVPEDRESSSVRYLAVTGMAAICFVVLFLILGIFSLVHPPESTGMMLVCPMFIAMLGAAVFSITGIAITVSPSRHAVRRRLPFACLLVNGTIATFLLIWLGVPILKIAWHNMKDMIVRILAS
jgi:amino acid transporter